MRPFGNSQNPSLRQLLKPHQLKRKPLQDPKPHRLKRNPQQDLKLWSRKMEMILMKLPETK